MFKEYNFKDNQDSCLDHDQGIRLTDLEAKELIVKLFNIDSPSEAIHFDKNKRDNLIKSSRKLGLSIRQISRLTGISLGIVIK